LKQLIVCIVFDRFPQKKSDAAEYFYHGIKSTTAINQYFISGLVVAMKFFLLSIVEVISKECDFGEPE